MKTSKNNEACVSLVHTQPRCLRLGVEAVHVIASAALDELAQVFNKLASEAAESSLPGNLTFMSSLSSFQFCRKTVWTTARRLVLLLRQAQAGCLPRHCSFFSRLHPPDESLLRTFTPRFTASLAGGPVTSWTLHTVSPCALRARGHHFLFFITFPFSFDGYCPVSYNTPPTSCSDALFLFSHNRKNEDEKVRGSLRLWLPGQGLKRPHGPSCQIIYTTQQDEQPIPSRT